MKVCAFYSLCPLALSFQLNNASTENLPTHNKHDKTDSNKILNWPNLFENKVNSEDFTIEVGKFQSVWDNQSILEDF